MVVFPFNTFHKLHPEMKQHWISVKADFGTTTCQSAMEEMRNSARTAQLGPN